MSKYLIFDLGTTYFKACLFDQSGSLIDVRRVTAPVTYHSDGRAELVVTTFKDTLLWAIAQLINDFGSLADIVAVSFATQANSFTLLDKHDQPLLPIIIWKDERAHGLNFPLLEFAQTTDFYRTTGVAEMNHQCLPAKLAWLNRNEPSLANHTRKLVCMSDFLTLWFTGKHITEASVAWLTGLADIHQLQWWSQACQIQGLPLDWLPTIVRAGTDLGPLLPDVAHQLGLPIHCRFIVGCLDQFSGAIGAGNTVPGMVSETTGTVLATVRCADEFRTDRPKKIYQGPTSKPNQYYQMVFGDVSALLLENYRNSLPNRPEFIQLDEWAATAGTANGLKLCIDRDNNEKKCRFINRAIGHTQGNEVYAILEAVAEELSNQVKTLCEEMTPPQVRSTGGAARSDLWQAIKSEKLGFPAEATACEEPTSLGAAMLVHHILHRIPLVDLSLKWVKVRDLPSVKIT